MRPLVMALGVKQRPIGSKPPKNTGSPKSLKRLHYTDDTITVPHAGLGEGQDEGAVVFLDKLESVLEYENVPYKTMEGMQPRAMMDLNRVDAKDSLYVQEFLANLKTTMFIMIFIHFQTFQEKPVTDIHLQIGAKQTLFCSMCQRLQMSSY